MLKAGPIYVFEEFLVTEFEEGAIVDFECFLDLYNLLDIYSPNNKAFGFLSNRVNSYSVRAGDFLKAQSLSIKKYPTAVVTYNESGRKMFAFEKQIYKCQSEVFGDLDPAMSWLTQTLQPAC